ncbi:5'-methylthioadenosine nucleosidase [Alphaproteobacteria bacterium]|nr:5'-methylthioadenosine nucleosidase [Alphaproteobacteria bacterium]
MKTIFVAALKEETPELNKFHHTGVGKINASIKLMELIQLHKPTQVINYGTAGSLKREISGLVECTNFVQHDMDARGLLNFKLGETPFDPISKITISNEGYTCGSGDRFVKSQLEIECDIVDMEAYALAKICNIHNIEFKCYKYISDYANDDSSNDWIENCHKGSRDFISLYPNCK